MKRTEAFSILEGVWKEFVSARYAVSLLETSARSDPTVLPKHPDRILPSHLRDCLRNLEVTYILRLFSEFEALLRGYWAKQRPGKVQRRTLTEVLINRLGALLVVGQDILDNTQLVREYRNQIVHHAKVVNPVALPDALSRLNQFLSFFPLRW